MLGSARRPYLLVRHQVGDEDWQEERRAKAVQEEAIQRRNVGGAVVALWQALIQRDNLHRRGVALCSLEAVGQVVVQQVEDIAAPINVGVEHLCVRQVAADGHDRHAAVARGRHRGVVQARRVVAQHEVIEQDGCAPRSDAPTQARAVAFA